MADSLMDIFVSGAALFLIFFVLSEDFQRGRQRLKTILQQRPRLKFVAYPVGALLFLGAAALIIHLLVHFAANRFSYD